jgi:signal transduction histidine kinase
MGELAPIGALLRHELRTPLSAVRGYLETILAEDLSPQTMRRFLRIALSETRRISALLDDLGPGAPAVAAPPADVERCVREALASLEGAAARAGVSLRTAGGASACASIPAHRLTQLLVNVVENAIKHGARPGRVEVWSARYAERVFIAVNDDGCGIPASERRAVFEPGRRLEPARTAGAGLGLAFVAWAVGAAGGKVSIDASPLGGARVLIELRTAGEQPA